MQFAQPATRAEETSPNRGPSGVDAGIQLRFFPYRLERSTEPGALPTVPGMLSEAGPTLLPDDLIGMYFVG